MAWSLIGTPVGVAIAAGTGTQSITLPGPPAEGDLVLVATSGDISCADSIATSGYTVPENGTGANPGANFGYKVMTSSPDTAVLINKHSTVLKSCVVQVWRGGYAASILDQAMTTPASGTSANPNATAIVTQNANALVVTVAHLDDDDSTVNTWPTNYTNGTSADTGQSSSTVGSTTAMCSRVIASAGSEDPGAYTMSSSDAWDCIAIAFRIQPPAQTRELLASIVGSSTTPSIGSQSVRAIAAAISGVSVTPLISNSYLRCLLSGIVGSSVTPSISSTLSRGLQANILGVSSTPGVLSISVRNLLASITGESVTPSVVGVLVRSLLSSIVGGSVTPGIIGLIERGLQAAISGASITSNITITIGGAKVVLNLSDYITGGGVDVTTGQLTPPGEKTKESDFQAGLISDDTNPLSGIDLGADKYTELEWALKLSSDVGAGDEIEFRITDAGAILSGYTQTAKITVQGVSRELLATILGASLTPDIASWSSRSLLATIPGVSTTPDISILISRGLSASLSGVSVTPNITITMVGLIQLLAAIAGVSVTPNISSTSFRSLLSAIPGVSLTPGILSTSIRLISSNIPGVSSTPNINYLLTRNLLANITGSSITPEISLTIIRSLVSTILGTSVTPNITITLPGIIQLLAAISGSSITPSISATTVRSLISNIPASSTTANILATTARNILANILGVSSTPNITITLQNLISLSASIVGVSISPTIAANLARTLSALIVGQSSTPTIPIPKIDRALATSIAGQSNTSDLLVTIARVLLADIHGTSVTPDDLIATLLGLGIIVDPYVESITTLRSLSSKTVRYSYEDVTIDRDVESI